MTTIKNKLDAFFKKYQNNENADNSIALNQFNEIINELINVLEKKEYEIHIEALLKRTKHTIRYINATKKLLKEIEKQKAIRQHYISE